MSRRLFYCDHYAIPLPAGHKFPMSKYRLVRDLLDIDEFYRFECAPMADPAVVELAHDPEYVRRFLEGSLPAAVIRRIGFPWSEGLVKRTLASVGGTMNATMDAFQYSWGGNLAGGTHHAFRSEGCAGKDASAARRSSIWTCTKATEPRRSSKMIPTC
jgi:acetoin utilization deacetylase AcuC-like enzyme